MKKSFLTLLLTAFMLMFTACVALAFEPATAPIDVNGEIIAEEGTRQFIAINPELLEDQAVEVEEADMTEADEEYGIEPMAFGTSRIDPVIVAVFPLVIYNGQETVINDVGFTMISEPVDGLNYIADTFTREQQAYVMNNVANAGVEQIGWYYMVIYKLDVYKPISWSYYEYTGAGKSVRKGKTARNGENQWEFASKFDQTVLTDYKLGIDGKLSYQSNATGTSGSQSIGLYVYVE